MRRPTTMRVAAAGLALMGVSAAALVSCGTFEVPAERSLPADGETLAKVTLTSPGSGEVLIWNDGQGRYALQSAEKFPIETRTVGCITCHEGQKEPHPDDLSYNLERMIGCTDCHGGVGWVSTRSLVELAPELERYLIESTGVAEVTSEVLAEKLKAFKTIGDFAAAKRAAHVHEPNPHTRERWAARTGGQELSSGNPELGGPMLNAESWEYVRFVNPGDLRVAAVSCGTAGCHGEVKPLKGDDIVLKVQKSMMATSPMLWGAALYNNGAFPLKTPHFGESYGPHGEPQSVLGQLPEDPAARAEALLARGQLERLDPLPRFEVGQPSNILRIFERGQRRPLLIGDPTPGVPGGPLEEEPGRPLNRLSQRGLGTQNRTDPVWLNLQRTRLMDPTLNMLGTNDQPGDFRSSGCTGCHMVYANDRDPLNDLQADCWGTRPEDKRYARYAHHQGPYRHSKAGGEGVTQVLVLGGKDAADKDSRMLPTEPGHPIRHELTSRIPSAQCVTCHMHPGTAVEQSYLGYMWWDLETDGERLWPKEQVRPSPELQLAVFEHNPEGSTPKRVPPLPAALPAAERAKLLAEAGGDEAKARDLYYRRVILGEKLGSAEFNAELANMQLGDFKGHGFLFRAVFQRDPRGNLQRKHPLLRVEGLGILVEGEVTAVEGAADQLASLRVRTAANERTVAGFADRARAALAKVEAGKRVALLCQDQGGKLTALEAGELVLGRTVARKGLELELRPLNQEASQTLTLGDWVADDLYAQPGEEAALLVVQLEEGRTLAYPLQRTLDILPDDPDWAERWKLAVHLQDIHLERGMHCVDCHYGVDNHGDGNLYGELRAATAIKCEDCHGTVDALAPLRTSGNAGGQDLLQLKVRGPGGSRIARFEWQYPAKKDKKTGEWSYKDFDPTKEKTAYRSVEARLVQRSVIYPELEWEVPQVMHSIDPGQDELAKEGKGVFRGRSRYNPLAQVAKTVRKDGSWGRAPERRWGGPPIDCEREGLAHEPKQMECYACHTSWMTSCFGCHLDMKANWKRPALHNEGEFPRNKSPFLAAGPKGHAPFFGQHAEEYQRNWTTYSFQTLRTDFFMLGKDGDVSGGRFVPVRSACAVTVGSQNGNRENVYSQQQTISAEGFSGTAFSPHFPHTVRGSRACVDCHVSQTGDNNAKLAQTLMLGTNAANFIGRYCYVAAGKGGLDAVVVTEKEEPQAVLGSRLHQLAFPEDHARHVARGRELTEGYHHAANSLLGVQLPLGGEEVRSIQLRGEYLYTANGSGGVRIYDVAQIDQKGFSERIVSAPVSPLGQRLYVRTTDATAVRAPSTQAVDPTRNAQRLDRPQNREQQVHLSYAFLYVTDRVEGLILIGAGTLLDGDPDNNFLERAVTFNPGGVLKGAMDCLVAGTKVFVVCDAGLVVVDVSDPLHPRVVARSAEGEVKAARAIDVQLDYAFVGDQDGLKVLDISRLWREDAPAADAAAWTLPVVGKLVDPEVLPQVRSIYLSRAYGYIAGGPAGLVVVDLERPREPRHLWSYTGKKRIFANDVKVAATNASMYAYVASGSGEKGGDAVDGLFVLQLTGFTTDDDPYASGKAHGSNPTPSANEVAFYRTRAAALAISEGIDRDRAVDEAGHQTGVFGRLGSRPFTQEEMRRLLKLEGGKGAAFAVPDLRARPAALNGAERAQRDAEVLEAFNRPPFRRLETSEDDPAVRWPERKKRARKPKK